MSKTLIALLFAVPFAAPVAATQYLRVVNAASTPIVAVEAASAGSSAWSRLPLAGHPVYPGRQLGLALDGPRQCRYDLRMVYADGREVLSRGFNLCRHPRLAPATMKVAPDEA